MAEDREELEEVSIGGIEVPDFLRPQYANHVAVNHTPWDFRLVFSVLTTPLAGAETEEVKADGEIHPEAIADMIIPANLMFGLIAALQTSFDRYMSEYGAPGMDPEGPRLPE